MKTDYSQYSFKYCGGTWKYCNGHCEQCIYTQTTTTTKTTYIKQNINYNNTTGTNKYDEELEVKPNGKTTYTY